MRPDHAQTMTRDRIPKTGLGLSAFLAMVVFLAASAEARFAASAPAGTANRPVERALVRQISAALVRVAREDGSISRVCPSGRGPVLITRSGFTGAEPPQTQHGVRPLCAMTVRESLLDLPPPAC